MNPTIVKRPKFKKFKYRACIVYYDGFQRRHEVYVTAQNKDRIIEAYQALTRYTHPWERLYWCSDED